MQSIISETVESVPKKFAVNLDELAEISHLSVSYLRRLAKAGKLPGCRRLGWRYIVHLEEFETWLRAGGRD